MTAGQIVCPRCGYDLRGPVASWQAECPISGTCPECGLQYRWGELLSRELNHPHWNIESPFSGSPFRLLLTAFCTLAMSLRPWRFWRELRMTHHPRWRRLVCYPLILLPMLYVAFSCSVAFTASSQIRRFASRGRGMPAGPPALLVLEAGLAPFSTRPLLRWPDGSTSAPIRSIAARYDILNVIPSTIDAVRADRFVRPGIRHFVEVRVSHSLIMILLSPVGFIALPISRRVCRVRWRHVARIWLYGLPVAVAPLAVDTFYQLSSWNLRGSSRVATGNGLLLLIASFLIVWWSLASGRYLKMKWPWLVGIAVVVLPLAVVLFIVEACAFIAFKF